MFIPPFFQLIFLLDLEQSSSASEHTVVVFKYGLFVPSWLSHSVPAGAQCPSQAGVEARAGLLV